MELFWQIFWKIFGFVVLAAFAVSGVLGIITGSADIASFIIGRTFVIGLGICGVIGLVVVPIELYLKDKIKGGGTCC
jgi:hypothetical protein